MPIYCPFFAAKRAAVAGGDLICPAKWRLTQSTIASPALPRYGGSQIDVSGVTHMAFFRFLFNLLWFVLGGIFMGLAWWLAGLICFISLVGIPWGRACFVIGTFTFFPFGKQAVNRKTMTGQSDIGTGTLGLIGNILWFVLIGIWLAIGHIASALACFVTIIGIPFGIQHLKLALISLAPIGQMIVTNHEAESGRYIR